MPGHPVQTDPQSLRLVSADQIDREDGCAERIISRSPPASECGCDSSRKSVARLAHPLSTRASKRTATRVSFAADKSAVPPALSPSPLNPHTHPRKEPAPPAPASAPLPRKLPAPSGCGKHAPNKRRGRYRLGERQPAASLTKHHSPPLNQQNSSQQQNGPNNPRWSQGNPGHVKGAR